MNVKGGYSLIDCFDVNITSDPVKIEGIFKKYQMSKRKAFLLSNVTINNTQLNDVFSTPYFEAGKVCFPAYDGVIKIFDTDYVTFEATADVIADKYLSKEDFLTIESDNTPYVSRTARDGLVKIPQLVGGTVAWNQMIQNGDNWRSGNKQISLVTPDASNNTVTVTPGTNPTEYVQPEATNISVINAHKYLYSFTSEWTLINGKTPIVGNSQLILIKNGVQQRVYSLTSNEINEGVFSVTGVTGDNYFIQYQLYLSAPMETGDSLVLSNCMLFDLTQMFGTAIADYVYSLEQATEGSGIAWLKSYGFFTKDYYAYDPGSLQSVCTSARKITALDGTVRNYPIDNEELRGLFKLDTNNKLYADGDIYPSSGNGIRKYGIVDLGSLDWVYSASGASLTPYFYAEFDGIKSHGNPVTNKADIICAKYTTALKSENSFIDKSVCADGNTTTLMQLQIKDSAYTDAATFKTAMSGVYLVYELATETTFSADSYINPQRSEGTEEFVDGLTRDVMIPVGNNSTYYKDELFNIIGEYIDSCDDAVIAMIPEGE